MQYVTRIFSMPWYGWYGVIIGFFCVKVIGLWIIARHWQKTA